MLPTLTEPHNYNTTVNNLATKIVMNNLLLLLIHRFFH